MQHAHPWIVTVVKSMGSCWLLLYSHGSALTVWEGPFYPDHLASPQRGRNRRDAGNQSGHSRICIRIHSEYFVTYLRSFCINVIVLSVLYYNLLLTNFTPRISSLCIYVDNTYRSWQQPYAIQLYGSAGIYLASYLCWCLLFLNLKIVFWKIKAIPVHGLRSKCVVLLCRRIQNLYPLHHEEFYCPEALGFFFFFTALLRYISHTMKSTHSRCTVRWFLV